MKKQRFEILEVVIVIGIICILAAMIIPAIGQARQLAKFSAMTDTEKLKEDSTKMKGRMLALYNEAALRQRQKDAKNREKAKQGFINARIGVVESTIPRLLQKPPSQDGEKIKKLQAEVVYYKNLASSNEKNYKAYVQVYEKLKEKLDKANTQIEALKPYKEKVVRKEETGVKVAISVFFGSLGFIIFWVIISSRGSNAKLNIGSEYQIKKIFGLGSTFDQYQIQRRYFKIWFDLKKNSFAKKAYAIDCLRDLEERKTGEVFTLKDVELEKYIKELDNDC